MTKPRLTAMTRALGLFLLLSVGGALALQPQSASEVQANFNKFEYQLAMRDGVKLFTSVYAPKNTSQKYPILLSRTPYGVGPYGANEYRTSLGPSPLFMT